MRIRRHLTALIQGPLDNRTHEAIDCYQGFGEVIVSTWKGEDLSLLDKATGKFEVVENVYPDSMEGINNHGHRYFMARTILGGCEAAKYNYIMKTRTDELYPDLDAILANFDLYPTRVHTTDNGFWRPIPFCFSNHLFIDDKHHMTEACKVLVDHCEGKSHGHVQLDTPEQAFGWALMKARGIDIDKNYWMPAFGNHTFITPCSMLKGHLHSGGSYYNTITFKRCENYPWGRPDGHQIDQLHQSHLEFKE